MIERFVDPIYKTTKESLKKLEIEAVLLDLDDTLIYTSEIFVKCMEAYSGQVSRETGLEMNGVLTALKKINDDGYVKWGVSPEHWGMNLLEMGLLFPNNKESIMRNLPILMSIYEVEPRMREGAKTTLEVLRDSEVKLGLVTHANEKWTKFKLDVLGLWDYFDVVVIVDEKDHKKGSDWKKAMDEMQIEAGKCLVVGDNLEGDVLAGNSVGARTMWIPSPWSLYRVGVLPEETVKIGSVADLLAGLSNLR